MTLELWFFFILCKKGCRLWRVNLVFFFFQSSFFFKFPSWWKDAGSRRTRTLCFPVTSLHLRTVSHAFTREACVCVRAWGERGRETVSYAYVCVSIVLEWEIQSVCEIGPESKKKRTWWRSRSRRGHPAFCIYSLYVYRRKSDIWFNIYHFNTCSKVSKWSDTHMKVFLWAVSPLFDLGQNTFANMNIFFKTSPGFKSPHKLSP